MTSRDKKKEDYREENREVNMEETMPVTEY